MVLTVLCFLTHNNATGQNLIYPEDTTDSYYLPKRFRKARPLASIHHCRMGNGFRAQKNGTVIYGVGCIQPSELPLDGEAYIWLYKYVNGNLVPIDSVNICNAVSNTSVVAPRCSPTIRYDTLPILEFYFDTAYPIDDTVFGLCFGTSRLTADGNL